MTPTYTAPRTWTAGEVITAALMNTHVRDMFDFALARGLTPTKDLDGTVGSTSNSSFTDMGSSFAITTTRANAVVRCVCFGTATQGNSVDTYNLTLDLDGSNLGDSTRGVLQLVASTGHSHTFCIDLPVTVSVAGAHTLKLQAKRSAGTSASVTITAMVLYAWEMA